MCPDERPSLHSPAFPEGSVFSPFLNNLETHLRVRRHSSTMQKMLQLSLTTLTFNTYLPLLPSGTEKRRPSPCREQDATVCDLTAPGPRSCADATARPRASAPGQALTSARASCRPWLLPAFTRSGCSVLHLWEEIRSLVVRH